MNESLQSYLNSFKEKNILVIFCLEILLFAFFFVVASQFSQLIQAKTGVLASLADPQQLQQLVLSAPEEAQQLLSSLRSFTLLLVGGLLVLFLLLLMGYSIVQAYVWTTLTHQKWEWKTYWKWNVLHLLLGIFFIMYLIPVLIFKLVFSYFFSFIPSTSIQQFSNDFLIMVLLLIFFIVLSLIQYSFVQKHKIGLSLTIVFHAIRHHWSTFWKLFLCIAGTMALLTLLLIPLQSWFILSQTWLLGLTIILFLLFLAWLRIYLVKQLPALS